MNMNDNTGKYFSNHKEFVMYLVEYLESQPEGSVFVFGDLLKEMGYNFEFRRVFYLFEEVRELIKNRKNVVIGAPEEFANKYLGYICALPLEVKKKNQKQLKIIDITRSSIT